MHHLSISALPDDSLFHIFSFLSVPDLGRVARVCKLWADVSSEDELWRQILIRTVGREAAELPEPAQGWRMYFRETAWGRKFDPERHHPAITVSPTGHMASVEPDARNSNYKGCMVKPPIPLGGVTTMTFKVKFTSTPSGDHLAIGVANQDFNTTKDCPDGWTTQNAGVGWYSSNGAVYMGDMYTRVNPAQRSSNALIHSGDEIGVRVDRVRGRIRFLHNGEEQPIGADGDYIKINPLYVCFILMHHVEVTLGSTVRAAEAAEAAEAGGSRYTAGRATDGAPAAAAAAGAPDAASSSASASSSSKCELM